MQQDLRQTPSCRLAAEAQSPPAARGTPPAPVLTLISFGRLCLGVLVPKAFPAVLCKGQSARQTPTAAVLSRWAGLGIGLTLPPRPLQTMSVPS